MAPFMWHNTSYDNELWHIPSARTVGRVYRSCDADNRPVWHAKLHWMENHRVFLKRTTAKMFVRAEAIRHAHKHYTEQGWGPDAGMPTADPRGRG